MKKIPALLLAALLLTGCTAGVPDPTVKSDTSPAPTPTSALSTAQSTPVESQPSLPITTDPAPAVWPTDPAAEPTGEGYRCDPYLFYSNLSDSRYYTDACRMVDAIAAYQDYLPIESAETASAIADNIFYNYPPAALCTFEADGGGIRIDYTYEREEHQRRITDFYAQTEAILNSTVDPAWPELRVAMELYRAVSVNVSYFSVDYTEADTSAYCAITRGVSICYGFADCYNYLLRQAGIQAELLRGYRSGDRAEHGWSIIKLDGMWYHCDPTWESSGSNGIGLMYFGMNDSRRYSTLAGDAVCGFGALEQPYNFDQASDGRFVSAFFESPRFRYGPWDYADLEQTLG